jgi:hypothetical protein
MFFELQVPDRPMLFSATPHLANIRKHTAQRIRLHSFSFFSLLLLIASPALAQVNSVVSIGHTCVPAKDSVYLGSSKQFLASDPFGDTSILVNDRGALLGGDGLPEVFFPAYAGAGDYATVITATNCSGANAYLYGFIDFNGNGVFDAKEISTQVVVPSTATAIAQSFTVSFPAGFGYNRSAACRYARFRIGTVATQVATPFSNAGKGETEEYRFNTTVEITGTVRLDLNGLSDGHIDGAGIAKASHTPLFAILVDAGNKVLESVAVSNINGSAGKYKLTKAGTNNTFTVLISTMVGTVGGTPPKAALPAGWSYTGEGYGSGDGTPDGSISGTLDATGDGLVGVDFGIEQFPLFMAKLGAGVGNTEKGKNRLLFDQGCMAAVAKQHLPAAIHTAARYGN